jgi:hypothetical protein
MLAQHLALDPHGRIVAIGNTVLAGDEDAVLVRFNSNGELDRNLDPTGIFIHDYGSTNDSFDAIAIQADGRIVLGGFNGGDTLTLFRLWP